MFRVNATPVIWSVFHYKTRRNNVNYIILYGYTSVKIYSKVVANFSATFSHKKLHVDLVVAIAYHAGDNNLLCDRVE